MYLLYWYYRTIFTYDLWLWYAGRLVSLDYVLELIFGWGIIFVFQQWRSGSGVLHFILGYDIVAYGFLICLQIRTHSISSSTCMPSQIFEQLVFSFSGPQLHYLLHCTIRCLFSVTLDVLYCFYSILYIYLTAMMIMGVPVYHNFSGLDGQR